jgi:hypothetical protein
MLQLWLGWSLDDVLPRADTKKTSVSLRATLSPKRFVVSPSALVSWTDQSQRSREGTVNPAGTA